MLDEMVGRIRHRILLNYRIDPVVVQRILPTGFRPKLVDGVAIGGICQVSLEAMRPKGLPSALGVASHNAAHRIAVLHDGPDGEREGVYIPRRDTSSAINALVGGRLFPGVYRRAQFDVASDGDHFCVTIDDPDGAPVMRIVATRTTDAPMPRGSVFPSLAAVSAFFAGGAVGWSTTADPHRFDAIELRTDDWRVEPLDVTEHVSGFFGDATRFPDGSVTFDCALVMRDLAHSWVAQGEVCTVCA
jgi:uncharacterized protein YqjF (DUF2071 family)